MSSGRVGKAIVLTCFFMARYGRHRKSGVGFRTAGYGQHRSQWVKYIDTVTDNMMYEIRLLSSYINKFLYKRFKLLKEIIVREEKKQIKLS